MEIGIDVGGTKIAAGLVHNGKVLRKITLPTPQDRVRAVCVLRDMIFWLSAGKQVTRIGIGVPGLFHGTKITYLPHIPALHGVDLKRALGTRLPIVLENDARCFALAEARYGAAKGKRNVVGIVLGTGVGGGIILDGKIYRGNGAAGEIGHIRYRDLVSVEQQLSGPGLVAQHHARGGSEEDPAKIWSSSTRLAKQTREGAEEAFALLVANLVSTFDPDVIVVGGGVSHLPLVDSLKRTLPGCAATVKRARLEDAGIIGAALVAGQ